ncbi:MAG: metallophosphoesterase [Clostridia bacterium]|nr:metallophosphoesterase [Clostridia bacterium]MBR5410381.1 metallophosphoesterase [Clostridia bacterium]
MKYTFYLLTDPHYLAPESWVEGEPVNGRERGDQIALKATPGIFDSFAEKFLADETADTLLITGDLVNAGAVTDHESFKKRLDALKAKGKRVWVTTATHDYSSQGGRDENIFGAVRYIEDRSEPAESVYKTELLPLYYDYGPADADSVHEESGSYSAKLCEGLRLIMINDNGNGRSFCGLFADGVKWLSDEIDKAQNAGEKVILAVHHPVIAPWEIYRHVADFEMYGGYKDLSRLMCEKGVRVIFTGHTHVQNIRKYEDENGNYFYDVSTVAMGSACGKMRKITFDTETKVLDVTSIGIETIKGLDTGGKSASEYIYGLNFIGLLENSLPYLRTDWNRFVDGVRGLLPTDQLKAHPALWKKALKSADNLKMSTPAKFGKKYNGLGKEEIKELKSMPALPEIIKVIKHIYPGNGPFGPDTVQYKVFTGVTRRVDHIQEKLHIKKLAELLPEGQTLTDVLVSFLYNDRTGDDDAITIQL